MQRILAILASGGLRNAVRLVSWVLFMMVGIGFIIGGVYLFSPASAVILLGLIIVGVGIGLVYEPRR